MTPEWSRYSLKPMRQAGLILLPLASGNVLDHENFVQHPAEA